jgi:hypothetical protein
MNRERIARKAYREFLQGNSKKAGLELSRENSSDDARGYFGKVREMGEKKRENGLKCLLPIE